MGPARAGRTDASDPDGGARLEASPLRPLRLFLLLHGAARSVDWAAHAPSGELAFWACALGVAACLGWAWRAGRDVVAVRAALPVLLVQLALTFPLTHNHFFVELFALVLLALEHPEHAPAAAVRSALQWMIALVLFQAGLQKVLYGLYFRGEFLAFMVGESGRFSTAFSLLLPSEEIARLAGYDPLRTGSGPYRVESLPFVLVSNAFYLAELALAPLLLVERTRAVAAVLAVALVVSIQLAAREAGFAALFAALLLAFLDPGVARRALPALALFELFVLAARLGLAPGGFVLEGVNL